MSEQKKLLIKRIKTNYIRQFQCLFTKLTNLNDIPLEIDIEKVNFCSILSFSIIMFSKSYISLPKAGSSKCSGYGDMDVIIMKRCLPRKPNIGELLNIIDILYLSSCKKESEFKDAAKNMIAVIYYYLYLGSTNMEMIGKVISESTKTSKVLVDVFTDLLVKFKLVTRNRSLSDDMSTYVAVTMKTCNMFYEPNRVKLENDGVTLFDKEYSNDDVLSGSIKKDISGECDTYLSNESKENIKQMSPVTLAKELGCKHVDIEPEFMFKGDKKYLDLYVNYFNTERWYYNLRYLIKILKQSADRYCDRYSEEVT